MASTGRTSGELKTAFAACRGYFVAAAWFSLAINLLYLASPLYMLQVYDRVISSGSVTTLVMLTIALLVAFVTLASLDVVRARVLARAGVRLDRLLAGRVVAASVEKIGGGSSGSQFLRDFDTFRNFVTGAGVRALFDVPWAPIYIVVIFLLHPILGLFALCSAVVLVAMAVANEWLVHSPLREAGLATARNYAFTEMSLRNSEAIRAMGMMGGLLQRWNRDRALSMSSQIVANDRASAMQGVIRFLRMAMQSMILGLGAYLAIERMTSVGAMFAASLLLGRCLQPVELVVGQWRSLLAGRAAYVRIRELMLASPQAELSLILPKPAGHLSVENLHWALPGTSRLILRAVSFHLRPGEALGIIGPSGAGKSTLARHLVGVLRPTSGAVRLDGADVSSADHQSFGRYLGYLPQDVELFADTVAANINRFQGGADAEVLKAAQLAGVHDMILRLSDGYETQVGEGATAAFSGGYRQRIALARAVFG